MKIKSYELFQVPPRWLFLKIETDEGIVGWGEPVIEGIALPLTRSQVWPAGEAKKVNKSPLSEFIKSLFWKNSHQFKYAAAYTDDIFLQTPTNALLDHPTVLLQS